MKNKIRVASAVTIAFGLVPLVMGGYELWSGAGVPDPGEKLLRIYGILFLFAGSLFFLGLGVLSASGVIIPYLYTHKGSLERAKTRFFADLLGLPFIAVMSIVVFKFSSVSTWKFVWIGCLVLLLWDLWSAASKLWKNPSGHVREP